MPETGEPPRKTAVAKGAQHMELEVTTGPIRAVIVDDDER